MVKHPQTNDKIERFFGEVERRIGKFVSVDRIVEWQNEVKSHMILNYQEPVKVSGTVFFLRRFSVLLRSGSMCELISGFHSLY